MTSIRSTVLAVALAVPWLTAPVQAQEWQSNGFDTGALIHGAAIAPGGSLAFSCTAPSPGGADLTATGDHEALRTDQPYGLAVRFSIDLIDPIGGDLRLPAPQMILDGAAYPLPPMEYSDFYGAWTGITSLAAPGLLELFQATSLVIDPGRGTAFDYPISGLSAALDAGLAGCVERWASLGHPMPPRLAAYVATGRAPDQPVPAPVPAPPPATPARGLPPGLSPAPGFVIPDVAPQAAFDHVAGRCSGGFDVEPDALQAADLDGDGLADYILNYSGLTCEDGTWAAGACGAANCLIEVFLSSRNHSLAGEFLGTGLTAVADGAGRVGLLLSGTQTICADGFCSSPFYWTGTEFEQ